MLRDKSMNSLLKVASELDKSGHYELSDKLFTIAQNNVVQQTNQVVNQGITVKDNVGNAKGAITIIAKISTFFRRNIPIFIKALDSIKSNIDKFESIPGIDKILAGLDLKSFIDTSVSFLKKLNGIGFANYWSTDAKEVLDFFISFTSTVNMLAGYIPLLAPVKIQMQAIDSSLDALGFMVNLADAGGNYLGNTNSALRNFTSPNNPSEANKRLPYSPTPSGGGYNLKDERLVGEVFNVLLDYVNKRGPLKSLVNKHIPDWDPEKSEKEALVLSYIKQNKLPSKTDKYKFSSYKETRDFRERFNKSMLEQNPDAAAAEYLGKKIQQNILSPIQKGIQQNIISPVQKGIQNYNRSIPSGPNTGYISPEKLRAQRMQQ